MPTTGKSRGVAAALPVAAVVGSAACAAALFRVAGLPAAVFVRAADLRPGGLLAAGLRLLVVIQAPNRREMTAA